MRLLFDHGVPSPLRRLLSHHDVTFARDQGWSEFVNGRLIAAAEEAGFELMVTCDKRMVYQQKVVGRLIGIAVLPTNIWPHLRPYGVEVMAFIDGVGRGDYRELMLPRPRLNRRPTPSRP